MIIKQYCRYKGIMCSLATEFGYCNLTACINREVKNNQMANIECKPVELTDSCVEKLSEETINRLLLSTLEATNNALKKHLWVPCSERLPSAEHNLEGFLTTVKCYDDTYDVFISVYENGKFGHWDGEKLIPNEDVVAWMELPEPYKGEKENNQ